MPAQTSSGVSTLRAEGVTKRYVGVTANDGVDIELAPGSVHALVGENGAGKSTLVKILCGLERPDDGVVSVDGRSFPGWSAREAARAGVGAVHQRFMLFPSLTVAENVAYAELEPGGFRFDLSAAESRVGALSEEFGLELDPSATVCDLPVGLQQRVEILRLLSRSVRFVIFDEPTAVLTPLEIKALLQKMRALADAGVAVLFVTHKLAEIDVAADRLTVMRRGRVVRRCPTAAISSRAIHRAMFGRDVSEPATPAGVVRRGCAPGLELVDVEVVDAGRVVVDCVSLRVHPGEIVGVTGVPGNGQNALAECIAGVRVPSRGRILLGGADVTDASTAERADRGLRYVAEDRYRDGAALGLSVADNLAVGRHRHAPIARRGWLSRRAVAANARVLVARFGIRAASVKMRASALSGGTLQRVVLARELSEDATVIVAAEPARGLDFAGTQFVRECLLAQRDRGAAMLLVTSELSEIAALADRGVVMSHGRISKIFDPRTASTAELEMLAADVS